MESRGSTIKSRGRLQEVVLAAAAMTAAGPACLALAGPREMAVNRASQEFFCPGEEVAVAQRPEVSPDVYDVEACGYRARYLCFADGWWRERGCRREATPPVWAPIRAPQTVSSTPEPVLEDKRRLCKDREDFDRHRDCVMR